MPGCEDLFTAIKQFSPNMTSYTAVLKSQKPRSDSFTFLNYSFILLRLNGKKSTKIQNIVSTEFIDEKKGAENMEYCVTIHNSGCKTEKSFFYPNSRNII
ncbi:MAG: hypothetical protein MHMPM18_002919 [Marteilia pararefringens]